ncbi:hypothetical protein RRG08_009454 [Elysia crispata]|uniref:Uncharacterized protein n=1 Tax=Elysia crispata TaxID=231223 RepID=A0AAE0XX53_9GAST|nr:hypothetical protein RRG08_009454 [Elysia crispata]
MLHINLSAFADNISVLRPLTDVFKVGQIEINHNVAENIKKVLAHRLDKEMRAKELFPEATGRTPLTENQPRCFASRACKPRSYREAPPTKKPVNTSPGQRVDGRPKPASIMTVQQKGGRISQGLKGDPFRGDISATLSPTERRTPSHEVPQSKPHRGRCGADRGRGSTATLHIATYNTRTLALQDDLDHLQEKLEDFKWNVIGLCETKRKGEGLMELSDGTWIYDAGKTEESPETKGMAFLVRKNFKDYIEGFCKHSDRVISCKVKLQEGYLPPYSPFLNICENALPLWKGAIKDQLAEVRPQLLVQPYQERMATLGQIAEKNTAVVTPEKMQAAFRGLQAYLPACFNLDDIYM